MIISSICPSEECVKTQPKCPLSHTFREHPPNGTWPAYKWGGGGAGVHRARGRVAEVPRRKGGNLDVTQDQGEREGKRCPAVQRLTAGSDYRRWGSGWAELEVVRSQNGECFKAKEKKGG
uniref:Uncharacterized protein n=1 Tax=Knipowitschia caucasica TaxID=637954 RepID=A0AAV2K7Z2_KNICA